MIRWTVALLVASLLALPCPAKAELDTGLRRLKQEQDRDELKSLEKKAANGDPAVAYEVGRRYRQGIGTTQDPATAAKWYLKAAEKGYPDAQFALGYLYLTGNGVPASPAKALEWFVKAGNQGHANAQYHVALLCESGQGMRAPDPAKAAAWYRKAAERGHSDAQFRMGMIYLNGTGVEKNATEARRWLKSAADKGNVLAKSELERLEPTKSGKKPAAAPTAAKPIIIIPGK